MNSKNFSKSSRSPFTEARARAKAFARDALLYLANDQGALAQFLAETGFDPADLRRMAHEPDFTSAMLDYLCSNESLLVAFAAAHAVDPAAIETARQLLSQPRSPDF